MSSINQLFINTNIDNPTNRASVFNTYNMNVNSFDSLIEALWLRKVSFVLTFFMVFLLSYGFLFWVDFLPEPVVADKKDLQEKVEQSAAVIETIQTDEISTTTPEVVPVIEETVYPDTIIIDSLEGRSVTVLNPTSRAIPDLDAALLYGVVRHPDSATLEQTGTVFLLGHSSYLPTVMNKNFKAFNGIQNLRFGDTVRLQSKDIEYVYRIDRVYRANASDVTVPIAGSVKRLVLATCNSFGVPDDRYIVEAEFVEVRTL